ncbi:sensor histidine kinase [Alicyclobacillus macrosporangiidus]|uniref:sensor histidine kinase n=1 Tax=Alicyclobacillus macrosporangiidus TaxID=392015 RepID=UPI000495010A|nr:ATP-binding protein [Alicyclobacillus macrosporangiidus]
MRAAIDKALAAISEGWDQVEAIARSTLDEVKRLEQELARVQSECAEAIEQVERLEGDARLARQRLMLVNREFQRYSEQEMQQVYEEAQALQAELARWREREAQLRYWRDDLERRLKGLHATARQAEVLLHKFRHTTDYLTAEFGDVAGVLEAAQIQSLLGLQVLQMLEEERRMLAQRLHDGPMQALASVAMRMQAAPSGRNPQLAAGEVWSRLNHVISDLRQMVFDLRPPLLDDLGLVPTLKRYAQQWSKQTRVKTQVQLVGLEVPLTQTEKVTVFRAVQQCLENVARHARASVVSIALTFGPDSLRVKVVDDGLGLQEADWLGWLEQGKLGLTLCRQRLSVIGGSMDICAGERAGTQVTIQLPISRGDTA